MKHHILSRTLSLTAAAALSFTAVFGSSGLQIAAAHAVQDAVPVSEQQAEDSTPVSVIVKVSGDAVLAQKVASGQGSDYLKTEEAAAQTAACKAVQQSVQERIRQILPELEISYSYSALFNGFACKLPANLIAQVEAMPDVISVSEAETVKLPQMNRAAAMSGLPAYVETTGCTGEGQVIAVIDTELDTSHPMFAALDESIETAISREDIQEIVSSGILNLDVDADRVYLSSKLPYVADYIEGSDPYNDVPDPNIYHGTHVSGIAAGNEFTDSDGNTVAGIAKDAQLLFFACGDRYGIDDAAAMAAFEDAVKLHADVITMSWGSKNTEYFDGNPFAEAAAAADNAGIVLCNSAGNDDNGTYSKGRTITPKNPDSCMITDKAEMGSPILFVASADNPGQAEAGTMIFQGKTIVYRPTMDVMGMMHFLSQELEPGDYPYVDCGKGTEEEMAAAEPADKLVLVQRSSLIDLDMVAQNAENFGAAGIIVIDKEYPDGLEYVISVENLKFAVITYEEGQMLREAKNKVVTFTGENVTQDYPAKVSSYSSWGAKNSLDLRPDIMGIGGRVRSADYDSSTEVASGTSMSSPYVAGCVAVLCQYLKQQGITAEGTELTSYIRRLLMNTAYPFEEDGNYVTPRRQGAGMVALDRAAAAKVLMTGPAGEAKVNLFDKLGNDFSFDISLTNYSDEDVVFADSTLRLTTDGYHYDDLANENVLGGQQALNCSADLSGLVRIGAGETKDVTVQVHLDAAQCAALSEEFIYGFFVEGYLLLSGAENSADISIPLMGFHGDWAKLPIGDPDHIMLQSDNGDNGLSLIERQQLIREIISRVPEEVIASGSTMIDVTEYTTKEEQDLLSYGRNEVWISPNNDGTADFLDGMMLDYYRSSRADLEILDAEGNTVLSQQNINTVASAFYMPDDFDQRTLAEGDYTLIVKAYINSDASAAEPQVFRSTFHVDKTAPEVEYEKYEKNGRTIIRIAASDDKQLQGVAVTGVGKGGVAPFDADAWQQDDFDRFWFMFRKIFYMAGPLFIPGIYDDVDYDALPYILRNMEREFTVSDWDDINFGDFVSFTDEEDGKYVVEYDVTDLRFYSLTVLDLAYNYVEITGGDDAAEEFVKGQSNWLDRSNGLYDIRDGKLSRKSFFDGNTTAYDITAEGNQLTLRADGQEITYTVEFLSYDSYQLTDNADGTSGELERLSAEAYSQYMSQAFYPVNEILERIIADSVKRTGRQPVSTEIGNLQFPELEVTIHYEDYLDGDVLHQNVNDFYCFVSLLNGRGRRHFTYWVDDNGQRECRTGSEAVILYPERAIAAIPAGLYYLSGSDCCCLFNEDGKTGSVEFALDTNLMQVPNHTPFTYTVDENGYIELRYLDRTLTGTLYLGETEGDFDLIYDCELKGWNPDVEWMNIEYCLRFTRITDDMEKIRNAHTPEEVEALVKAYLEASFGMEYPDDITVTPDEGYQFNIVLMIGEIYVKYVIDPVTLKGTDEFGNEIDLTQPPQLPEGAYSLAALEEMARIDYEAKTGTKPKLLQTRLLEDGSVVIQMQTRDNEPLDTYTLNPVSGTGSNAEGEAVDLPQTGNNDPAVYLLTLLAFLMLTAGAGIYICAVRRSRKKAQ